MFLFAHSALVNFTIDFDPNVGPLTVNENVGTVNLCVTAAFAPDLDISPLLVDGRIDQLFPFTTANFTSTLPFANYPAISGTPTFSGATNLPANQDPAAASK